MTLPSIISKYLDSNHSERVDLKLSLGEGKLFINLYDFSAIVVCFFPPLLIGNPNLIELREHCGGKRSLLSPSSGDQ